MPITSRTPNEIKYDLGQDPRVHYHAYEHEARLTPLELLNLTELHRDSLRYIEQLESRNQELAQRCDQQRLEISAAICQNAEQKLWFLNTLQAYIGHLPEVSDAATVVPYTFDQLSARYDEESDRDECGGLAMVMESRDGVVMWAILDRFNDVLCATWNAHAQDNFTEDTYGIDWRCWSRKPTDEERKAAKWDVE